MGRMYAGSRDGDTKRGVSTGVAQYFCFGEEGVKGFEGIGEMAWKRGVILCVVVLQWCIRVVLS